jgi:hypothetical protein
MTIAKCLIADQDKNKMRQFLIDCLHLIDKNDIEKTETIYQQMKGNADIDDSVTSNEELIKRGVLYK